MNKKDVISASRKTYNSMKIAIPIIIGVLMFISFFSPILERFYPMLFTGNFFIDPLIGALGGSVFFGIPITAYITGGELLKTGVSLLAVTAFILAWTTVGLVMMPLEISYLGRRFAIYRNVANFIIAIIIAVLTIITLNLI